MALTYNLERWCTQRWLKGSRYYICRVEQDLFGTWLTSSEWGGLRVGRRRLREEAYARFGLINRQRQQRGYVALFPETLVSGNRADQNLGQNPLSPVFQKSSSN